MPSSAQLATIEDHAIALAGEDVAGIGDPCTGELQQSVDIATQFALGHAHNVILCAAGPGLGSCKLSPIKKTCSEKTRDVEELLTRAAPSHLDLETHGIQGSALQSSNDDDQNSYCRSRKESPSTSKDKKLKCGENR